MGAKLRRYDNGCIIMNLSGVGLVWVCLFRREIIFGKIFSENNSFLGVWLYPKILSSGK